MRKLLPVLLLLPLLTACEKPDPTVTAASVGTSVRAEAICWSNLDAVPEGCTFERSFAPTLVVQPGEFVGFSVDKAIAKTGWWIRVNGEQVTPKVLTTPYYRFTTGENSFAAGPWVVEVIAITSDRKTRGIWAFTLQGH